MTDNLEHEFFTKVKGWIPEWDNWDADYEYEQNPDRWLAEFNTFRTTLPPISTSWDAFHEWVLPELMKGPQTVICLSFLKATIGVLFCEHKTPHRALEWAMEELQ